jgi:hypothetical protein
LGQTITKFSLIFSPEIVYLMFKSNSIFKSRLLSCLVVLLGTIGFQNATFAQNCTLACNNLVQISLDDDCNVPIVPSMILQPGSCNGAQLQVIVYQIGTSTPISTSPNVTAANIGQTLVVKVLDPTTGNSCWSNALIEDKLPPQITTTPIHLYCNWPNAEPDYLAAYGVPGAMPMVVENCGSYTLTHSDEAGDVDCNGSINNLSNISAYIKRTWVATDASGNHFNKIQWIYYDRKHVSDIDWPSDVTIECTTADIDPSSTGIPTIDFVTLWPESGFCELNVNYNDQFFQICEGSYKILRTWTGYDWCLPTSGGTNPLNHIQVIKVLDTHGPVFTCPNNQTTSTTSSACLANYDLPDVLVTDGCSSIKTAKATFANANGSVVTLNAVLALNAQNKLVAQYPTCPDLPKGNTTFTYAITDDCGNTTTCSFILTVLDGVAPIAICRQITQIGLGTDGMANVPSTSFDEGSYDNCGPVWFKTRRMVTNLCQTNDVFHEKVKFCCSDIGDTIMVVLRVYDVNPGLGDVDLTAFDGHYNDCMVEVYVVDKIKPTCVPPTNVTTTCEAFDPSLWSYGVSTSTDNCCLDGVTVSVNYSNFDTTCLKGTILRTFTAKDCTGNTSKCTQVITVNYVEDYQIKFPDDVELNACNGNMDFGMPKIFNENCELIAISHTDKVFTLVPDACFKIIRTWEIINWCTYDSNESLYAVQNPTNSIVGPTVSNDDYYNGFTYTQVIKIHDSAKPTILNCPTAAVEFCDFTNNDPALFNNATTWDPILLQHDLCEGPVDLKVEGTDDCSAFNLDIRYTIFADLNGDGSQETVINSQNNALGFDVKYSDAGTKRTAQATRNGATSFELPYGLHKIKWYVSDGCGNESVCEYAFLVKDCKKPTVVCLNGLAVNIMNTATPTITLWASDFVNYGQDNCTPSAQLVYYIRKTGTGTGLPTTTNVTYGCNEVGTQTVEVWAKDKAGNADFCETYLLVQDNLGNCGNTSGSVAGFILTTAVEGVQSAEVNLKGSNPALPTPGLFNMTTAAGKFNFTALPIDPNYILSAKKDNNPTNGVNTFDLVRMSKHVLNINPFTAPTDYIAADINKNGKVTTADIVELRKLILGIYTTFPMNESWRFVDKKYQFTSANPAGEAFPEQVLVSNANDFTAVKIGDVTGDALPNNFIQTDDRNSVGNLVFSVKNREITAGEEFSVDFTAEEVVAGYQFTLGFDGLEMLEIVPGAGMSLENFNTLTAAEHLVSTSFNGAEKGQFSVKFRAANSGKLSQMLAVSSRLTAAEAYNLSNENLDVAFRFENENGQNVVAGLGFELYQNEPNPVKESTNIRFYLPTASTATLTVSDATGRIIKTSKGKFAKGYNAISVLRNELPASGVLFYQVETSAGSATKRMIAID